MRELAAATRRAGASVLALALGAAAALAVAANSAEGPTIPCRGNTDATTFTQKNYTGSGEAETIQANDKDNVIYGRGGGDTICAYLGNDTVYGGRGGDDLWGEEKSDKLFGGRKADILRGDGGDNDLCKGGRPGGNGEDPDAALDCERVEGASIP